jgi:hypothetical protein
MVDITGTLAPPVDNPTPGGTPVNGTLDVQLCGFGSQVPRSPGYGILGRITEQNVPVDADGEFEFSVVPNDEIEPEGTYYTVTVKDGNGDIAQVNAYLFIGDGPFDLNDYPPYDPSQQPPPQLPPLIVDLLLVVDPADDMVFDGSASTAFKTTLTLNVTQPVFENMAPGNLYTFIIVQDGTGGWDFVWPANVYNASPVDLDPNSTTVQTFVADDLGDLYAISVGTYFV